MTTSANRPWPDTALDAAQRAFDLLCAPPAPLAFDCRGLDGLPQQILPLDELKVALIHEATPRAVRDAVWRQLVARARQDGPGWVVAAVGIAMPGLRRAAGRLARGWHAEGSDRDAELLAGFLDRLRTIDLAECRVAGKLLDAAIRAAKQARTREQEIEAIRIHATWSLPPQRPWDHPDWVLARAVAAAVIGAEENLLIAETRLGQVPLRVVADQLQIPVAVAGEWRAKAERRLLAAVRSGELDWDCLVTAGRRRHPRTAVDAASMATTLGVSGANTGRPALPGAALVPPAAASRPPRR